MSQQDNFAGGFFLGAIVGGIVGGVLGAVLATRQLADPEVDDETGNSSPALEGKPNRKKRLPRSANGQVDNIEAARRSLEDKIAQLNDAIDDVRQQLGGVHNPQPSDIAPPISKERQEPR
ncbi:hypothetical protein ACN4EK_11120 [Pantanalinema rosaneae CENA516]|uniref:hypothetical protein n=1 Tax=Pantanalinema rosaneae TaxID=1620701 RepID=UPI003D6FD4D7